MQAVQPMIKAKVREKEINCFIDTGAALSLITKEGFMSLNNEGFKMNHKVDLPQLTDVNDHPIKTEGICELMLTVGNIKKRVRLLVCDNINIPCPILLGMDIIKRYRMELDFETNKVMIGDSIVKLFFNNDENFSPVVNLIRTNSKTNKKFESGCGKRR